MKILQFVLFSTFSLMAWASVTVTREYLPPTVGRTYFQSSGHFQPYYPNRPAYTTGGYYQQGLSNSNYGGSGQNHYYNPGFAGGPSGQYNQGFGGGYNNPGYGGGYNNPGFGGGAGSGNYYNTGFGNAGGSFAQGQIIKPGYQPKTVIATDGGYVYGKKV